MTTDPFVFDDLLLAGARTGYAEFSRQYPPAVVPLFDAFNEINKFLLRCDEDYFTHRPNDVGFYVGWLFASVHHPRLVAALKDSRVDVILRNAFHKLASLGPIIHFEEIREQIDAVPVAELGKQARRAFEQLRVEVEKDAKKVA